MDPKQGSAAKRATHSGELAPSKRLKTVRGRGGKGGGVFARAVVSHLVPYQKPVLKI